jgi:hypothetical protein
MLLQCIQHAVNEVDRRLTTEPLHCVSRLLTESIIGWCSDSVMTCWQPLMTLTKACITVTAPSLAAFTYSGGGICFSTSCSLQYKNVPERCSQDGASPVNSRTIAIACCQARANVYRTDDTTSDAF